MDLYQFNRRPLEQRASIVMKHGTFLAIRHRSQYIISLYHINQFFAEMWYEPRRHEFVLVRGLRDSIALEPYLAMIRLSDITS